MLTYALRRNKTKYFESLTQYERLKEDLLKKMRLELKNGEELTSQKMREEYY